MRNLAEHVKLLEPLLPGIGHFLIGPELEADEGNVNELLNSAVLLERLKEAATLLVLTTDVIKEVDSLTSL